MTGATLFALANLTVLGVVFYTFFRIGKKLLPRLEKNESFKGVNLKYELLTLAIMFVMFVMMASLAQPKVKIGVGDNYQLQEYKGNTEAVIIVPAEPRTKKLEGFTPLKKED